MKKNNICVGSLVEDLQGRQGVVTEVREDCNAIFVRPVDKLPSRKNISPRLISSPTTSRSEIT